jgi:hypothetical protein
MPQLAKEQNLKVLSVYTLEYATSASEDSLVTDANWVSYLWEYGLLQTS